MSPGEQTASADGDLKPSKSKKRKAGRRRRGQKDVVLDFSKRAGRRKPVAEPLIDAKLATPTTFTNKSRTTSKQPPPEDGEEDEDEELDTGKESSAVKRRGKLLLSTSSKEYDGNLGLPDKVGQRQYETTGQFLRRLDRLVAKAKVEANLESRFDINLMQKSAGSKQNQRQKLQSAIPVESPVDLASSSRYGDKRRKRYGR